MPAPDFELKAAIRNSGLTVREVSDRIGRPYGTLASWLNGFAPLPLSVRRQIEGLTGSTTGNADDPDREARAKLQAILETARRCGERGNWQAYSGFRRRIEELPLPADEHEAATRKLEAILGV